MNIDSTGCLKRDEISLLAPRKRTRKQAANRRAPDFGEAIRESGLFFAQDAGHALYRFDNGVYRPDGDEVVRRLVRDLAESDEWKRELANEVVEFIRVGAPELREEPVADEINLLNGILNVVTREMRPHTPEFLSCIQLPVAYDPAATCPAWKRQVEETFPRDAAKSGVPWRVVAWLMTPNTRIQKALLLIGEGGTGKSTFLKALTAFLGKENVSNVPLHKLETDRFAVARLVGKLANMCADLPSTHLETSSIFKEITGGDRIAGERKFKTGFDFTPFARLVFSANQLPRSADASSAFYQRWIVVPFEREFRGTASEIDSTRLASILAQPQELSGVLNLALAVLPLVREYGLTESASMQNSSAEFRAVTDPVAIWFNRSVIENPRAKTPKEELLRAYNEYSASMSRPVVTETAFGTAIRAHRPDLIAKQRTINGKVKHCWIGIELKK
jgi:putative DNA primase/helicase